MSNTILPQNLNILKIYSEIIFEKIKNNDFLADDVFLSIQIIENYLEEVKVFKSKNSSSMPVNQQLKIVQTMKKISNIYIDFECKEKIKKNKRELIFNFFIDLCNEMAYKDKMFVFQHIYSYLKSLIYKYENTTVAIIKTAVEISDSLLREICDEIQLYTKSSNLIYKNIIDKKILGGFIAEFNNSILDLSISSKLDRMRKILIS